MEQLYGNDHIKSLIKNTLKTNRLAHAYLFYGENGLGKSSFIKYFAKCILCSFKETACDECINCKKINKNIHPDYIEVVPDEKDLISAKTTRDIIWDANLIPNESEFKIYFIKNIENLSINASNSLLKTLENPPKNVIFLLSCENKSNLLKTIVSRCIPVPLKPLSAQQLKSYLINCRYDTATVDLEGVLSLSNGNIGKALYFINDKAGKEVYTIIENINHALCTQKKIDVLQSLAPLENKKNYIDIVLNSLSTLFEDAFSQRLNSKLKTPLSKLNANKLIRMQNAITKSSTFSKANVNLRLNLSCLSAELTD